MIRFSRWLTAVLGAPLACTALAFSVPAQAAANHSPSPAGFYGVSCPAKTLCVAVGAAGAVVTSTDPTGGLSAWHRTNIAGTNLLRAISCPSLTFCVTAQSGAVNVSTDPSSPSATWVKTSVSAEILGLSCPSKSLCVGVARNEVVTSADPTGASSAWSVAPFTGIAPNLGAISCPSTKLCVAAGLSFIGVSKNPAGGPSTWSFVAPSLQNLGGGDFKSVSCAGPSLCVAVDSVGDIAVSTDPAGGTASAWAVFKVPSNLLFNGVSCPSTSRCIAVGGGSTDASKNPSGGAAAWKTKKVNPQRGFRGISCASAGLCVGVDASGDVVSSTDPTGGAAAWTVTLVL
jgi:hypothetical protein